MSHDLKLFRLFVASKVDFSQYVFYGTGAFSRSVKINPKKKVSVLMKLSPQVFCKALKPMGKYAVNEIFAEFVKIQRRILESKNEESNSIIEWDELSRTSQIKMIISYFLGEDENDQILGKRELEKEFVDESVREVENLFITFRTTRSVKHGIVHDIPRHLIIRILSFLEYDKILLFRVGRVSKDFYLIILSTWRRIRINPRQVFDISLLVMKNVRELSFSRKALSLSKKELVYVWDHITFGMIRVLDLSKCYGGFSKFIKSISTFQKKILVEEEDEGESEGEDKYILKPIVFNRCHTLILPTEKLQDLKISKNVTISNHFPNLRCLHINLKQLHALFCRTEYLRTCDTFESVSELHLTLPHGEGCFSSHFKHDLVQKMFAIEDLRLLKLKLKDVDDIGNKRRGEYFSNIFIPLIESMTNLETLIFDHDQKSVGLDTEFFNIFFDDHIPHNLRRLELIQSRCIRENKPSLPHNIPNPNCQFIKIHPLKFQKTEIIYDCVMTWDPIPSHFDVGINCYHSDIFSSKYGKVVASFDTFYEMCRYFLNLLHEITTRGSEQRAEEEKKKNKLDFFRIFTWKDKMANKCDRDIEQDKDYVCMKYVGRTHTLEIFGVHCWVLSSKLVKKEEYGHPRNLEFINQKSTEVKHAMRELIAKTNMIQKIMIRNIRMCKLNPRRLDEDLRKSIVPSEDFFRAEIISRRGSKNKSLEYFRMKKDL